MDETEIGALTRALFQGPVEGFIEARKALVAKLKKAGSKEDAARVGALAKPSPSAWATNRVTATAPDVFADLMRIGADLRSAMRAALQGKGSGQEVAKHQGAQRDAIEALVSEASRLLGEGGSAPSDAVLARVRANLTTIGTSGRWGDAEPACLSKDLAPLDVGALAELLEMDEPAAKPITAAPASAPHAGAKTGADGGEKPRAREAREAREAKQRELEAAADAADDARVKADATLVTASSRLDEAHSAASRLATRATAATEEAARLEAQAKEAAERMMAARRELDEANSALARAKRERDGALADYERKKTRALAAREAADRHRGSAND
ncbi:MAG: hypothetical protein U0414_26795 [Polyangiaceae bacterium]